MTHKPRMGQGFLILCVYEETEAYEFTPFPTPTPFIGFTSIPLYIIVPNGDEQNNLSSHGDRFQTNLHGVISAVKDNCLSSEYVILCH